MDNRLPPFPAVASEAQQRATREQNAANARSNQISTVDYGQGHALGTPVWGAQSSITRPEPPLGGQAELDALILRLEAAGALASASVQHTGERVIILVAIADGRLERHDFRPDVLPHLAALSS
jgi:hypothetical protein